MAHYEKDKFGKRFIQTDKGDEIHEFNLTGFICVKPEKWLKIKPRLLEIKKLLQDELNPEEISQLDIIIDFYSNVKEEVK